jgi:hypothetical protein
MARMPPNIAYQQHNCLFVDGQNAASPRLLSRLLLCTRQVCERGDGVLMAHAIAMGPRQAGAQGADGMTAPARHGLKARTG